MLRLTQHHFDNNNQSPVQRMSRAAWITFGSSIAFTSTLVYLVHRQQRVEKEVREDLGFDFIFL